MPVDECTYFPCDDGCNSNMRMKIRIALCTLKRRRRYPRFPRVRIARMGLQLLRDDAALLLCVRRWISVLWLLDLTSRAL